MLHTQEQHQRASRSEGNRGGGMLWDADLDASKAKRLGALRCAPDTGAPNDALPSHSSTGPCGSAALGTARRRGAWLQGRCSAEPPPQNADPLSHL